MRASLLAFTVFYIAGCSQGTQQEQSASSATQVDATSVEKPAQKISGAVADSLLAKLCKRWYSKKLVLRSLGEEYPTNNEELTLLRDMSYTAVDRVEGDSLGGTWQIVTENTIRLTDQSGESHPFLLQQLTADSLVTKVLDSEEEDISIHYGSME